MICGLVYLATGLSISGAGSRYGSQPPTVLSPDLTAPWVLQLRNKPSNTRPYSVGIASQKPRYRQRTVNRRVAPKRRASLGQMNKQYRLKRRQTKQRATTLRRKPPSPKPAGNKFNPELLPQVVTYNGSQKAGTLIVNTKTRFLYLVMGKGKARRYGIGVGKPGFEWSGKHKVTRKAEWPSWTPPKEMIAREAAKGHFLPSHMEGGPNNPLGARAMYLGSTLYRIHGTNQPWTVGKAVSSGCIRMRNEDVMDLYTRVRVGTRVVVI